MFNTATKNRKFNKANFYFVASFVVLVVAITVLLLLLKQQGNSNLKAQLLLSNANTFKNEIKTQQTQLYNLTNNHSFDSKFLNLYTESIKLTDLTRYFDSIAEKIRSDGSTFDFTSITYSEVTEGTFIPVAVTFTSTDQNLIKFLKIIEQSGISDSENTYLMELSSIAVNVENTSESETYSINMNLKVYNFYE